MYPDEHLYYDPEYVNYEKISKGEELENEKHDLMAYFTNPDMHFFIRLFGVFLLFAQSATFMVLLYAELYEYNYWNPKNRNSRRIRENEKIKESLKTAKEIEEEEDVDIFDETKNKNRQARDSIFLTDTEQFLLKQNLKNFQSYDRRRIRKLQKKMENAYKANREILKKGVGIEQSDIEADIKRKALEKRFKESKDKKIEYDMMEKKREQEEQEKRRKKRAKEPESTAQKTTVEEQKTTGMTKKNVEPKTAVLKKPSIASTKTQSTSLKTPPLKANSLENKKDKKPQKMKSKDQVNEQKTQTMSLDDNNKEMTTMKEPKTSMEQKTKPSAIQKKKEKTWSLQKTQGTLEEPPTTKRNTPARKNKKTAQPPTDFHNSVLQNMEKELGDEQFSSVFTKKKKTATRKK
ncbi:unnamed protein product [Caenorhabditis nigoni]